jgi:cold shock CspA family protein
VNGTVTTFDDRRGLGTITDRDGREYPFHATRLASGSRVIAIGTEVEFEVIAGNRGRWEAAAIAPR